MKVDTLIKMVTILPKSKEDAVTSTQIREEYYAYVMAKSGLRTESKNKHIRKQITDMFDLGILGVVPYVNTDNTPAAEISDPSVRHEKYYLLESKLLQYFMDSKVALNVLLSKSVMSQLGEVCDSENVMDTAKNALRNEREEKLLHRIRIVPDGIARENSDIKKPVLKVVLSAIENGHRIILKYRTSQGQVKDDGPDSEGRTVLGLVAKDGTLYLISCKGFNDVPTHIPLHRVKSASEIGLRTFGRDEFDLDKYIENQHQLAHVKSGEESPIKMVLKVSKEALFHFKERPICGVEGSKQELSETMDADGRYTLTVSVPNTVQLPPFLWSHAGWVEVISPPSLRKFVGSQLLTAAAHYHKDLPATANVTI